jgi:hypothetical protein|tara:strand:+ start:4043 stop:4309 length:267 start_codon:yes stop_codon:yes gene_type:complete
MSIPKINDACVMAGIQKAGQEAPSLFAAEFLTELVEADQKPVVGLLMALTDQFCDDEQQAQRMVAVVGLVWKQIEATMDAEEMNKAWM